MGVVYRITIMKTHIGLTLALAIVLSAIATIHANKLDKKCFAKNKACADFGKVVKNVYPKKPKNVVKFIKKSYSNCHKKNPACKKLGPKCHCNQLSKVYLENPMVQCYADTIKNAKQTAALNLMKQFVDPNSKKAFRQGFIKKMSKLNQKSRMQKMNKFRKYKSVVKLMGNAEKMTIPKSCMFLKKSKKLLSLNSKQLMAVQKGALGDLLESADDWLDILNDLLRDIQRMDDLVDSVSNTVSLLGGRGANDNEDDDDDYNGWGSILDFGNDEDDDDDYDVWDNYDFDDDDSDDDYDCNWKKINVKKNGIKKRAKTATIVPVTTGSVNEKVFENSNENDQS